MKNENRKNRIFSIIIEMCCFRRLHRQCFEFFVNRKILKNFVETNDVEYKIQSFC